jgi:rSAM/selenodomain-associated transferase 2
MVRFSVIIPTINEELNIRAAIESIGTHSEVEVIVVDGGSSDSTCSIVTALSNTWNARLVVSPKGRARQLNMGAESAAGEILVFLHADTRLPLDWKESISRAFDDGGIIGGAFRLRFDDETPAMNCIAGLANVRSTFLNLPYGDQAIFVDKNIFRKMRGFRQIDIMEDFDFVKRLRYHGKIIILNSCVITSARRWQKVGLLKTSLINQVMIIGYYMGFSPETLFRLYHRWK